MSSAPIYGLWKTMVGRCHNPNHYSYENYGARGIRVCDRWRDFENFYADMGDRPTGMSIDRIDNNGDYEPRNCQWASRTEQNSNKRLYKTNISGISGVQRRFGKWYVQITRNGFKKYLGMTDDFFEACCMRKAAEIEFKKVLNGQSKEVV